MADGSSRKRVWQGNRPHEQPDQPNPTNLQDATLSRLHNPSAFTRPYGQDERKLPPLSYPAYDTLPAAFAPGATLLQSPVDLVAARPFPPGLSSGTAQPPQLHHDSAHDSTLPRRFSLPPLAEGRGVLGNDNNQPRLENKANQPPPVQLPLGHRGLVRRQLSSTALPKTTGFGDSQIHLAEAPAFKNAQDERQSGAPGSAPVQQQLGWSVSLDTIEAIVSELTVLEYKLGIARDPPDWLRKTPDVKALGPQQSLEWVLQSVRHMSLRCDSSNAPTAEDAQRETPRHASKAAKSASPSNAKRKVDAYEREGGETLQRASPRACDDRFNPPDWSVRSSLSGGSGKKGSLQDFRSLSLPRSSRQLGSLSSVGSTETISPLQASPSPHVLSSLSSFAFSSNPQATASPSTELSPFAHAAHLSDLQHQISTKTLALQTLQREHDNLLSAFSRSQIRCATLERKFHVSDAEINALTEERTRLLSQIEAFDAQVDELISEREEARKQSVASGGQYMKIMAMASRLEAQGAADKKKWTAEEEEWRKEREGYLQEMQILQNANEEGARRGELLDTEPASSAESPPRGLQLRTTDSEILSPTESVSGSTAVQPETQDVLLSTSLRTLRREIIRLRRSCHQMETALQGLRSEGQRMDQLLLEFTHVRERIASKARTGIRGLEEASGHVGESDSNTGHTPRGSRSPAGEVVHAPT